MQGGVHVYAQTTDVYVRKSLYWNVCWGYFLTDCLQTFQLFGFLLQILITTTATSATCTLHKLYISVDKIPVFFLQKTQITIYQLLLFAGCGCVFLIVMSLIAAVLGSFAKLRKATIFAMSVRPSAWNISAHTAWISMKFDTREFSENLSRKFKFYYNRTRITGTLHEDQYTFLSYVAQLFLKWKMFQKQFVEKLERHILCSINFFFSKILLFVR